eukprot:jgi/Pico_ML_1/55018/g776.t1
MDDPSNEDFFAPGDVEGSDERQESPGVDDVTMNEVRLRSERTIFKLGSSETERTSRNG